MPSFQHTLLLLASTTALLATGGCADALIDKHVGSELVNLGTATQVSHCKPMGQTTVKVLSNVAFYTRDSDAVETNLLQLARNDAVDAGADTVVKGNSTEYGKRTFDMYKCH